MYYFLLLEEKKWIIRKITGLILIVVGIPAVYFISCKGNTYVNLCDAIYARPERYLAGAIFGSLMILGLGLVLEEVKFLRFIGKNTLIIFLSHDAIYTLIIFCVNNIWKLQLEPLRMDFDWICIGISLVTLTFCVGIVALVNLIKKKRKNRIVKSLKK